MSIRIGSGLSTLSDDRQGGIEAAVAARGGLRGESADIAIAFISGDHLSAPEATLEGVREALAPETLIGCAAGGVLACGREIERGTAVAVWAASLNGDATATPFHAHAEHQDDGIAVTGLPDFAGAAAVVLLPDPITFPTDPVLRQLPESAPGVPIIGGLASERTSDGSGVLFLDDEVFDSGAVGLRLDGLEVLPCVSQGAAPLGPELTITAAESNVIRELAGQPALNKVREVVGDLSSSERELLSAGLLLGIVVDANKPEYVQGDFLVRTVLGADPNTGNLAVGEMVSPGQVVRLHARDAGSADRDFRSALDLRARALGGRPPAGALLFSCNGRGRAMFGVPDHDAALLEAQLGGAPAAGFFAAGEIGPVGGESFLHAFTATAAIFP